MAAASAGPSFTLYSDPESVLKRLRSRAVGRRQRRTAFTTEQGLKARRAMAEIIRGCGEARHGKSESKINEAMGSPPTQGGGTEISLELGNGNGIACADDDAPSQIEDSEIDVNEVRSLVTCFVVGGLCCRSLTDVDVLQIKIAILWQSAGDAHTCGVCACPRRCWAHHASLCAQCAR